MRMKSAINLANIDLKKYEDFLKVNLPDEVAKVPSMMSPNERKYLFSLTKDFYKGDGIIIDAGVFLGGSTVCFGEGLKRNPNLEKILNTFDKPIQSFDRAQIYPNFFPFCDRHGVDYTGLETGGSFESIIRKHISAVNDVVDLTIGDVTQEKSTAESPKIEILFLDVIKRPDINHFVLENWFNRLIVDTSIVIQQDYFCEGVPHIPICMEYLDEYFEYLGQINSSSMYLFKKPIPQDILELDFQEGIDIHEQLALIDKAKDRTPFKPRKYFLDATKVIHVKKRQGHESPLAAEMLKEMEQTYPEIINSDNARLRRAFRSASLFKTHFV